VAAATGSRSGAGQEEGTSPIFLSQPVMESDEECRPGSDID
jgi:hypothetical protein